MSWSSMCVFSSQKTKCRSLGAAIRVESSIGQSTTLQLRNGSVWSTTGAIYRNFSSSELRCFVLPWRPDEVVIPQQRRRSWVEQREAEVCELDPGGLVSRGVHYVFRLHIPELKRQMRSKAIETSSVDNECTRRPVARDGHPSIEKKTVSRSTCTTSTINTTAHFQYLPAKRQHA